MPAHHAHAPPGRLRASLAPSIQKEEIMPQAICLMLSVLVALLSGCGESATKRGNNYAVRMAELEKKEIDIFKTFLMTATKESLKDPGSAQFNNVSYYGTYLNF